MFNSIMFVLVLLLLLVVASSEVCSSLSGPYCHSVNGLTSPEYFKNSPHQLFDAISAFTNNQQISNVLKVFAEQLNEAVERGGSGGATSGSYRLSGYLEGTRIVLFPTGWISRPSPHWTSVGLVGTIVNHFDFPLQLTLTDEDGEAVEACTPLKAELKATSTTAKQRMRAMENKEIPDGGEWEGVYNCAGVDTNLLLSLKKGKKSGDRRMLSGVFAFSFSERPAVDVGDVVIELSAEDLVGEGMTEKLSEQLESMVMNFMKDIESGDGEEEDARKIKHVRFELSDEDAVEDASDDYSEYEEGVDEYIDPGEYGDGYVDEEIEPDDV